MTNAYEEPYRTEYAIFDPVYDSRTGAEYWRDRLGYRLVLREANASAWAAQHGTLEFDGRIQNVGFGNIVNQKRVSVILKPAAGGASYTALTDVDARDWRPDLDSRASNTAAYRDLRFSIDMRAFGEVPVGGYDIYLKINDPKETTANKRTIRFANNGDGIWDADLGANLIGRTTVEPDIRVGSVTPGNRQADIDFAIASANGKGYSVYLRERDATGPFAPYALVSFNSHGVHVKGLVNGTTYLAYVVYDDGDRLWTSETVTLTPGAPGG
jgi:hypothetical protein